MKSRAQRQRIKEIVQEARIPYTIVGRIVRVAYEDATDLNIPVQSRSVNGDTGTIIMGVPANTVISRTKHNDDSGFLDAEGKEYIQVISFLKFTAERGWCMALDWGKEYLPVSIELT